MALARVVGRIPKANLPILEQERPGSENAAVNPFLSHGRTLVVYAKAILIWLSSVLG
jgi:hypothetical protein